MIQDARILWEATGGPYWTCPNCQRIIASIVGTRIVIIVKRGRDRERRLNYPLIEDLQLSCDYCGVVSVYRQQDRDRMPA